MNLKAVPCAEETNGEPGFSYMPDPQSAPTISIVVPLYNERENVRPLYARLTSVLNSLDKRYELIFVDDGSRDQTGRILDEICESDGRVIVVQLRRNFGQAAALQAGFDVAQGDIIISMDGDLQHEPEDIPQFLAEMAQGYDIVSGWRMVNLRRLWKSEPTPAPWRGSSASAAKRSTSTYAYQPRYRGSGPG